ncbi:MAG: B12-binding domain-containing radical SAM protein [Thermodesulfobacteriota bacterium]
MTATAQTKSAPPGPAPGLDGNQVALIKIWHGTLDPPRPPMGLLFVGAALKKAGFAVKVYHWTKDEALAGLPAVIAQRPFLVGLSIITGDPLALVLDCAQRLKAALPGVAVVLGGVHATVEPAQCLAEDAVDYVVLGEGEETAVALALALAAGAPVADIPGLGYKRDGRPVVNPRPPLIKDLDQHDMDWSLIPVEKYIAPEYEGVRRVLFGYVASRGCPHACGFCYNHFFNQRTWRKQSPEKVIADIDALKRQYDLGGVFFYDDNFTANKKWALSVLEGLKTGGLHVETRVDYLSPEFLADLAGRGVGSLFIGMESGSDRVLDLLQKGFHAADARRVVEMLKTFPGFVMLSFIVGAPSETLAEYQATLRLVLHCLESLPRVGFTLGFFLPYPGTPLFEMCVARGFARPARLADWEALDRWGGTDLAIPWTEGYRLTTSEVKQLRGVLLRMKQSRRRGDPLGRLWHHLLRQRFLRSATPAGRRLARLVAWVDDRAGRGGALGRFLAKVTGAGPV